MIQVHEVHNRIISILQRKGPCLPIHVAKELNISTLFVSAFLAELVENKKVKISNLKVGGSPLYFLGGHETQLANFYNYLHPKESEAFLLLKENKVLRDNEQEPAIRVALRSIKDFAFGFIIEGELYWRYLSVPETEAKNIISTKIKVAPLIIENEPIAIEKKVTNEPIDEKKIELVNEKGEVKDKEKLPIIIEKKPEVVIEQIKKKKIEIRERKKERIEFDNPLVIYERERLKKEKPKSAFVLDVIDFLNKNNFKIIEEKELKSREYRCVVEIKSQLGLIQFFTEAKDKKTITDSDIKKLLSDAQKIPLPALIIYSGGISKKAKEYLIKYSSILKAKKLE